MEEFDAMLPERIKEWMEEEQKDPKVASAGFSKMQTILLNWADAVRHSQSATQLRPDNEDAKQNGIVARKYLESHRSNIGDVKEYFEKINDKMEQELDELVAEAIEKKVILDGLGKRADHSSPTKKNQPEGCVNAYEYLDDDISVSNIKGEEEMEEEPLSRTSSVEGEPPAIEKKLKTYPTDPSPSKIDNELEEMLREIEENEKKLSQASSTNLTAGRPPAESSHSSQPYLLSKNMNHGSLVSSFYAKGPNKPKIDFV